MTEQILVVDDDPVARRQIKTAFEGTDLTILSKASCREAFSTLKQNAEQIDVVLLTLPQDLEDGLSFIRQVADTGLSMPVVVQLQEAKIGYVAEVLRAGAFDFIIQPASRERLQAAVTNALKVNRADKSRILRRFRPNNLQFSSIISASQSMMRVVALARKAAHNTLPIILEGEIGVGKYLLARTIHSASERSARNFAILDCHAFAQKSSELGAERHAAAMLEYWHDKITEADGGTLYLNEIGDLPPKLQSKLLELVQTGQQAARQHSGHDRQFPRIISATSKDLIEEVRAGRFRDDLYYRLNVFPIAIAALRKRKEDIPHLVRLFCEHFSSEQRKPRVMGLSADAMALLTSFDWPGNVQQLENALYRAITLAEGSELTEQDFPQIDAQSAQPVLRRSRGFSPELIVSDGGQSHGDLSRKYGAMQEGGALMKTTVGQDASRAATFEQGAIASINEHGDLRPLAEIEEELIRFALGFYRGQMSQVARKLGIGRSTLYRKLKDYGIDPDDPLREVA